MGIYDMLAAIGSGDLLDRLKLAGFEPEEGSAMICAGAYDGLVFAQLVRSRCDLALMPEIFADLRVNGYPAQADNAFAAEELSDEDAENLAKMFGALRELGIPVFVDRSRHEETAQAALEWIKVYGILFGFEKEANAAFNALKAG